MSETRARGRRTTTYTEEQEWRLARGQAARFCPAKLKQARVEAGLTQTVVAQELGKKEDLIRQWENGERAPNGPDLLRLMIAYNCSANDLCTGRTETGKSRLGGRRRLAMDANAV